MEKKSNEKSIFDKSGEQEFTWQSKHIKYFLSLKNIGPATLEEIINLNPDINLWNKNYFELILSNFHEVKDYLPDSIPNLENLDDEVVINFRDPRFPDAFKNMKRNKPLLLWFKGSLSLEKSIAVVGSRNIIPETSEVVDSFTKNATDNEFAIVSGLANGVDERAHIAALNNNAKTVAILPSSLDNILPQSNRNLAFEILENGGLLLSEYEPGSPKVPHKGNYIARNRLQAGLSDAVFVAQTGLSGGTMSTVKHSIDNQKKLIVYSSKNDFQEYKGNMYLTSNLEDEIEHKKILDITEKQKEYFLNEKRIISDFIINSVSEAKSFNLNQIYEF